MQIPLARMSYQSAKRELERLQSSNGISSATEVDKQFIQTSTFQNNYLELQGQKKAIKSTLEGIKAQIQINKSLLTKAQNNLKRSVIQAPYNGHINAKYVQQGTHITLGTALFQLVDTKKVEIAISLAASHFSKVAVGASIEILRQKGSSALWKGTIQRISPTVDVNSSTFQVYCEVGSDDDPSPIPPGTFVLGYVNGSLYKDVFVIPRLALFAEKISIAKPQQQESRKAVIERRQLEIIESLGDVVLVSESIAPGELLVISNLQEIANGSKVTIVPSNK